MIPFTWGTRLLNAPIVLLDASSIGKVLALDTNGRADDEVQ